MTKAEFKRRWEKDDRGDGISFDDIAACAVEWGIASRPKICPPFQIRYRVLKAAGTVDAEEFKPVERPDCA